MQGTGERLWKTFLYKTLNFGACQSAYVVLISGYGIITKSFGFIGR